MTRFVPYLSEEQIERDAAALLAEYAQARGVTIAPPIPIEDLVEKHLKLGIEFDDTHRLFGVPRSGLDPDILGAMFFDEGRIVIDESLDPEANPAKESRYFYTVAHEGGGHWRLHRHLFAKHPALQAALFEGPVAPSVICRSSQAKERVEWQADFYASCLLMPRRLVHAEWHERLGRTKPLLLSDLRPNRTVLMRAETLIHEQGRSEAEAVDDALFENVAERFARRFGVSRTAMRIRLEKLGLLLRADPRQQPIKGIL